MNMKIVENLIKTTALSDVLVFVEEYMMEYPDDTKKEFVDALVQYLRETIDCFTN